MTLEQLFYSLGVVFIISWLVALIALVILVISAFRRFKAFKQKVKTTSVAAAGLKLANTSSLKTLLAVLPILQMGASLFKKNKSKKRAWSLINNYLQSVVYAVKSIAWPSRKSCPKNYLEQTTRLSSGRSWWTKHNQWTSIFSLHNRNDNYDQTGWKRCS